jgi:hypothetical protein
MIRFEYLNFKNWDTVGCVLHTYNPSAMEVEAEGWQIQGQTGLHSETPILKRELGSKTMNPLQRINYHNHASAEQQL